MTTPWSYMATKHGNDFLGTSVLRREEPVTSLRRPYIRRANSVFLPILLSLNRCVIIPLAAGVDRGPIRRSAPQAELKLLMVGRLSRADRYKGVDTLLEAVRMGRDEGLPLGLEIIGAGDDTDRLESPPGLCRFEMRFAFEVHYRIQEVQRAYDESHVFVMPS